MAPPERQPAPRRSASPLALSVVVPVRDGAGTLDGTLLALKDALAHPGAPRGSEIVVVDDGSTDATRAVAERHADRVVATERSSGGAAAARNRGAAAARGDVLLFVDADVVVEPDAVARLHAGLHTAANGDGPADAAIGVYTPCDAGLGVWSRVKDLSVRRNHGRAGRDIRWFWTAFGAVRAAALHAVGGFDARRFGRGATVEDMELGFRLSARGYRIVQVADARARHLHRFTAGGLLRNDFAKSRDWARVLLRDGAAAARSHGSTNGSQAFALACALTAVLGVGAAPLVPPAGLAAATAGLGGLAWLLRDDLRQAAAERGVADALAYLAVRAGLYPVAGAGAVVGLVQDVLERGAAETEGP